MRKTHRISIIILTVVLAMLFTATPVFAIVNPDTISFGTGTTPIYNIFENVLETGDMLITAEGYVDYTPEPTDYTADEAFIFQLLNVAGDTVLTSVPLRAYGDRPISIYLTATQVTALAPAGLVSGAACRLRITGNPLVFADPTGNTVTATLAPSDYIDQLLGVDGGIPTANPLRNNMIQMVENIEAEDAPPVGFEYFTVVQGYRYLTALGGDIFIAGIPALTAMCPILFQSGLEPMTGDEPESTGTYAGTLTPLRKWGSTTARGLTDLGLYFGISQSLAGSMVLFVLALLLGFYVYRQTQSGLATMLLLVATPFVGVFLGLMPMALAFVFTMVIIVLMGFYFFSRGAL